MVAKETLVATVRYDTTTIARWAKAAIAHAEVEPISDPAGYFATVPACKGARACGPTPESAIRELEEALADRPDAITIGSLRRNYQFEPIQSAHRLVSETQLS